MKVKNDHRKFSNLSNWKEEAWKKSGLQRDLNPWPPRCLCVALPTELWSHTLGARSIYWVHISREEVMLCYVMLFNGQLHERWFLTYEHFYFIIKTCIKLVGFFYCYFFMTLLSNHFYPFFCANYCVIVTTNFSRYCGWLRFASQPKLLFFTLGI